MARSREEALAEAVADMRAEIAAGEHDGANIYACLGAPLCRAEGTVTAEMSEACAMCERYKVTALEVTQEGVGHG